MLGHRVRGLLCLLLIAAVVAAWSEAIAQASPPCSTARIYHFYVSQSGSDSRPGTRTRPFRTITRALEVSRLVRYGIDGHAGRACPITVHIGPGDYVVTYDESALAADPTLEAGPILLNVSNLELRGSGRMGSDADGFPVGFEPGTGTTIMLRQGESLGFGQMLVVATPTTRLSDGAAMDPQVLMVSGIRFEGATGAFLGSGILVDRVAEARLVENEFTSNWAGVITVLSNGELSGNLAFDNLSAPLQLTGGGWLVYGNRSVGGFGGLLLSSTSGPAAPFPLSMGLHAGEFAQTPWPDTDPAVLNATVVGNHFSDNDWFGVRVVGFLGFIPPDVDYATAVVDLYDNEISLNDAGLVVDAGFSFRSLNFITGVAIPHPFTFDAALSVEYNHFDENGTAAFLSTTEGTVTTSSLTYEPMEDSIYDVTIAGNTGLDEFGLYHPELDTVDGRILNNNVFINEVPQGYTDP